MNLFEKCSCAVFLDFAPDDMTKKGPMIKLLMHFWNHFKKKFFKHFCYAMCLFGHLITLESGYILGLDILDLAFGSSNYSNPKYKHKETDNSRQ